MGNTPGQRREKERRRAAKEAREGKPTVQPPLRLSRRKSRAPIDAPGNLAEWLLDRYRSRPRPPGQE